MQTFTRRRLGRGAALAAALTLSCGRGESGAPAPAPASSAPATAPAPRSTASQVPGETAPSGALPQDLPSDVPSYPGASVVTGSNTPEHGVLITFRSKDSPENVFEFYRQKLAEQGWNVEGEMSSADQRMLIAGKGDRKASVLVSAGEAGETEITLTLTHEES